MRVGYARVSRKDQKLEPQRIVRALSHGPDDWYEGLDEFDSYVVFTFPGTEKVWLECPL